MKPPSISRFRVPLGRPLTLNKHDPDEKCAPGSKRDAQILLAELHQELNEPQEVLYAEGKRSLLLVLQAMDTALRKTSTPYAPWYVVPANRKWSRDIIIANILIQTLRSMKCKFPPAQDGLDKIVIPD